MNKNCIKHQKTILHTRFQSALSEIEKAHRSSGYLDEPMCKMVTGPAGSGKTTLVSYYLSKHPRKVDTDRTIVPVLASILPANATPNSAAEYLLDALGDPNPWGKKLASLTHRLATLLKNCRTELIMLDECQRMIDKDKGKLLQKVSEWLVELHTLCGLPIVLLGKERSSILLEIDDGIERRFGKPIELGIFSIATESEFKEFARFVHTLEKQVFGKSHKPSSNHSIIKIYAATGGLTSKVCKLLFYIQNEVKQPSEKVVNQHYETAFEELFGLNKLTPANPFNKSIQTILKWKVIKQ